MASHAGITSIRSQSESKRKAWHSNSVRICVNVLINILFLHTFFYPWQTIYKRLQFGVPYSRWYLLSIHFYHSSLSDSRLLYSASWIRVRRRRNYVSRIWIRRYAHHKLHRCSYARNLFVYHDHIDQASFGVCVSCFVGCT